MTDAQCRDFLEWCGPRLCLRAEGFARVRRQVRRNLGERIAELGLNGVDAYRARLESDRDEWRVLDALCRVTISRFWRDRAVFDRLSAVDLPGLAREAGARPGRTLSIWSAGCASGEEPYTLALIARYELVPSESGLAVRILATDADPGMIERAIRAEYRPGTLRYLPDRFRDGIEPAGPLVRVRPEVRDLVSFSVSDVRTEAPAGPLDAIFCRNLVFTYHDEPVQRRVLSRFHALLTGGGLLVIGARESLPSPPEGFEPVMNGPAPAAGTASPGTKGREPDLVPGAPVPGVFRRV